MISKFIGKGATIKDAWAHTYKKPCVIEWYDKKLKKYKVIFDGGWCGWYKLKDLNIDIEA